MSGGSSRNWAVYARALDLRLEGKQLKEIAAELGVSKERARQLVEAARKQLAYRVFKGVARPLPPPGWNR